MKNIIFLTLITFLFSCSSNKYRYGKTSDLELRQLVNITETESYSSGSASLFFATYHSREYETDYVKVFAKVDGSYRYLKFSIEKVRIKLDSRVHNPYIVINYRYYDNKERKYNDSYICNDDNYNTNIRNYTIVCHEKYLPEKLLPIDVTK